MRNLLDFTRKDEPMRAEVSIEEVLEATLKLVRNELTLAKVEPRVHIASDLPPVKGNPRNLQQVFLNLFLNAIQAMPQGGVLDIRAQREGEFIQVAVQDTGVGIPADAIEKIFEPFFTTKEAGEGTGLGLTVSYSIVEKHGGRIEVTSTPGSGSTFFVLIPVAQAGA